MTAKKTLQTHTHPAQIPHWSGLGRLKRSKFPSLSGGGHQYGGGASPGLQSVLAGRLLCDTYLASRDLVREVDYTLSTLARSLLGESRGELAAADVPGRYAAADRLLSLVRATESDAWLALGLAARLSVLPLTRALAALSGSSWNRSLAGQRAQRIESLLLHEFYNRKFLLPDRLTGRVRGRACMGFSQGGKGKRSWGREKCRPVSTEAPASPGLYCCRAARPGPQPSFWQRSPLPVPAHATPLGRTHCN